MKADGTAENIPDALHQLVTAGLIRGSSVCIDNTAIMQGRLCEAAHPTVICALSALPNCPKEARPWLLELIAQIGMGEAPLRDVSLPKRNLQEACINEIIKGSALSYSLIENTNTTSEICSCVDILGSCCRDDSSLIERTKWYFNKLLSKKIEPGLSQLIAHWLDGL